MAYPKAKIAFLNCILLSLTTVVLSAQDKMEKYPGLIGWDGDLNAVCTKISGAMVIRSPLTYEAGFKIYESPTSGVTWENAEGHLPCLITEWTRDSCIVRIRHFADRVAVKSGFMLSVFSRVEIKNTSHSAVQMDPAPYGGLAELKSADLMVAAGSTAVHDYYLPYEKSDDVSWEDAPIIPSTGTWDDHYNHMKDYWENKLLSLVQFNVLPDQRLVEAFKAEYIYIQIIKDYKNGIPQMNVGENSYDGLYNHDLIGIAAMLITIGDFQEIKSIMGTFFDSDYPDGTYKYPWPFALYLLKSGDVDFVKLKFSTIKTKAHFIASSRTGPGTIMKLSWAIDATNYWTVDNYSALIGLWSYRYICMRVGNTDEEAWAKTQYDDLLTSFNKQLSLTIAKNDLNYIPAAVTQSDDANRCKDPKDANWASMFHFGRWPWDGFLLNAPQNGPSIALIDSTYSWGLARAQAAGLPLHTFGGFPNYSAGYNTAYGTVGLRGAGKYRSELIHDFQFLLENCLNSPNATFEGINYPQEGEWVGNHPAINATYTGSCPHAWSMSFNMKGLTDAIVAERSDSSIIVGRGVPDEWVRAGKVVEISNFPVSQNKRMGVRIERTDTATVSLTITGEKPLGNVVFNLPLFLNQNITSVSTGTVNWKESTVEFAANAGKVLVKLRNGAPVITATTETIENSENISVFPNPLAYGKSTVQIRAMEPADYVDLNILDLSGRIIFVSKISTDNFGNGSYVLARDAFRAAGTYVVVVMGSRKRIMSKLIVL